ncbi:uncharacterized protein LOC132315727 [Cornus florida]|uniref:uncharacterized protein LOC132315727 n=1 Tax=Cornus florida TaxID=4283 RepID=UPI00289CBB49|nr:uncharacterized protein LOC132315727 [Cornus florida]
METADWENEDWEFVNDDGFVYKRKKRRLDPTTTSSAPPPPDPAAEERNRRQRKKRALVKLREKYQKEIDQWELLSNTVKAIQEKAQNQQQQQREQAPSSSLSAIVSPSPSAHSSESACRRLVDELLLRVEAEEAIIQNISNLCDSAEAICNAQEEPMMQSLIDLPIWASPRDLMASLCDE